MRKQTVTVERNRGTLAGAIMAGVRFFKPAVRKTVRLAARHPEVVVFGGIGYAAGGIIEKVPVLGWAVGAPVKIVGGVVGAVYGYNKSMDRRKLDAVDAIIDHRVDGCGEL